MKISKIKEINDGLTKILNKWVDFDEDTDTLFFPSTRIATKPLREVDCYDEYEKEKKAFITQQILSLIEELEGKLPKKKKLLCPNIEERNFFEMGFNECLDQTLQILKEYE
jgi:hypothetical protein